MKKFAILALLLSAGFIGCGKKPEPAAAPPAEAPAADPAETPAEPAADETPAP
ncbi:MAG: hypothetical protein KF708_04290 [Pirellulales bacterium]|nr:hypothetical protein [Pirellulales bacterium]